MNVSVRALTACLALSSPLAVAREDIRPPPRGAPSSGELTPPGEPGTRLEVKGVVYAADGRTPVPNASLYV